MLGVRVKIHPDIKYEGMTKCWYIRNDWSIYTTIKGKLTHRLVYELCNGPLKEGMFICHKCDRAGCIRPDHLFQGTSMQNFWDAINKNRIMKSGKRITRKDRELDRIKNESSWVIQSLFLTRK